MFRLSIISFFIFSLLLSFSHAEKVKVFEFTNSELENLKVRKVRGAKAKTEYSVGKNENGSFLKAIANNSASV